MRQRQILAGAVREIGSDLRISPYLSNTSQRNHASVVHRLRRDITANRVAWDNIVCAIRVQAICRHFDVMFGCFVFGLESLAFQ